MADMMHGLPETIYAFSHGKISRVYEDLTAAKRVRTYDINNRTRYSPEADVSDYRIYRAKVVWEDITDEL